jgi:excisionase family DNA binding protein
MGTCPVATAQAMFLWLTSAGWPAQSIQSAPNSELKADQILYGPQQIQNINWNNDHISIFNIMLPGLAPAPQVSQRQLALPQQPQMQPQQPQMQPQQPQMQPQQPQQPQMQPQMQPQQPQQQQGLRLVHSSTPEPAPLADDEKHLARLLAGAAKKLRSGSSAADIAEALSYHLMEFDDGVDDSDAIMGQHLNAQAQAPANNPQYRSIQPGEVPQGLTPEQVAQFSALSDPAAEEKMRRTMERSQAAILRARAHAAQMEAARQAQAQQAQAQQAQAQQADGLDEDGLDEDGLDEIVETVEFNGEEYFTVDSLAEACGVHSGTVRKWIKKGRLTALKARLEGDRVDRYLIPADAIEALDLEAQ